MAQGNITVQAKTLQMRSGGTIRADTQGSGKGGSISIKTGTTSLDGVNGQNLSTGISVETGAALDGGKGGDIHIQSDSLNVTEGASISASTLGSGRGGSIQIRGGALSLNKGLITSQAKGTGEAGSIGIKATGNVTLGNESSLAVTSDKTNGGSIDVQANDSIDVTNSNINAQASGNGGGVQLRAGNFLRLQNGLLSAHANGNGGNVSSQARYIIFDRSTVLASAVRGNGGNITLRARVYLPSAESVVDASSQFGVAGNVAIESPNTNIGGSLIILPSQLLDAESYLAARCAVRDVQESSSFTVSPQNGVPTQPGDLLPSSHTK